MFEKYTEKARRVIFFARYEASQFGSPYIETQHMLLGILREDKALANRIFKSMDAVETIRKEIESNATVQEKVSTSVDLPLSNENKRVLDYAAKEAKKLAHQHIAPGHLLLGLMREEKCFAAKLLSDHKVQLEQVREAVRNLNAEKNAPPEQPDRPSGPLSEFGIDITLQAQDGTLPPLIGREREIQRIIQVLSRLTGNNPLLVGEPGVGKKTIVYGLAQQIVECAIPNLQGRSIVSLDLAVIESGVKSRARFEQDLEKTLDELLYDPPGPIFFIDGLHALAQTERFLSVANVLKPALLGGSAQCISTATAAEYAKTVEAARWLDQCFTPVRVNPPDEAEAINVLHGVKERFQQFHEVTYTDEAIRYAVFHSNSYFPNRCLPEKAIDLMDEAGARVKLRQSKLPEEIQEAQKRARSLRQRHDSSLDNNEFEKARFYADELKKERENLKALVEQYKIDPKATVVTREDIEQLIAQRTGLSIDLLRKSRVVAELDGEKKQ